jgi:hypothetical protein
MSIGPSGITASAAGSPLAQSKPAEADRTEARLGAERRQVYHEGKAESAAGVGQPDGDDHETAERDGDGHRPWEDQAEAGDGSPAERLSKDPSQQRGNLLDLTG